MKLFKSLKYRLFLVSFSQVLSAILILSVIVIYTQKEKYELNSIEELNSLGEIIGQTAEPSLLFEQFNEIDLVLENFKSKEKIDAIWVINKGQVVSSFKKDSLFEYPENLKTEGLATEIGIFSRVEIKSDEEKIGEVIIRSNLIQLENDINSLYNRILFSSSTLLLLLSVIAFIVQNSVAKPIIELSSIAKEIKRGNFNARAKVSSTYEIDELNDAFNQMIDQISYEKQISEELLKTRGQFFSSIGKKVNSEANEMRISMQQIINDRNLPSLYKEEFKNIEFTNNKIANTIDDILVLTSKNERKIRFNKRNFSLVKLKDKILDSFKSEIDHRNIQFKFNALINQEFQIDDVRLIQALEYLIQGALNFKLARDIRFEMKIHKNLLHLRIQFNHFEDHHQQLLEIEKIIAKNTTSINIQKIKSLSELVCLKTLIEYQANFIVEKSNEESILNLSFVLPDYEFTGLSDIEIEHLSKLNVLLIEPSELEHNLMLSTLERFGIKVISGRTGDDLFDLVKYNHESINIILSEEDLPITSASLTFKSIFDELPGCPPIIICTSNSNENLNHVFEEIGIHSIHKKPMQEIKLLKKIIQLTS